MVNLLFLMTYFVNHVSQGFPGGASIFCWSDNDTEKNCNEVGFDVWVGLRGGNNKKTEKKFVLNFSSPNDPDGQ